VHLTLTDAHDETRVVEVWPSGAGADRADRGSASVTRLAGRGFTLIEVLLGLVILGLPMHAAYAQPTPTGCEKTAPASC
jgi:prepilin-type N-terminal cleavage/methylation domain-containing protein